MSSDPENDFFADGITEEITNALTQIQDLRVAARTSAFSFRGKDVDLQTVGERLGVVTALEGSIRKSGNRIRITAQLVNVVDGYHLWSERYDRELQDIFAIQDEIAKNIATRLMISLGVGEEEKPLVKAGTRDLEAYQFYLKGRFFWNQRSADGLRSALEYFQKAIAKDPNYAAAFAGLADAYNLCSFLNVLPTKEAMPKAKAAAVQALAMDPSLAEAEISLGYASFTHDFDWDAAAKHFERALLLNPVYTKGHAFFILHLSALGRSDDAIRFAERALDLDPASPGTSHVLSVQLYLARHFDRAIAQCHKTLELDPNYAVAYGVLGQAHLCMDLYREALPPLEKFSALTRGAPPPLGLRGYAHGRLGETTQALSFATELQEAAKRGRASAFFIALVYAGLGDRDQAFAWLAEACEDRFNRLAYLRVEALWKPLYSDSRFGELLKRLRIPL